MGVPGEHVASVEEFEAAFGRALNRSGPTLLDIDQTVMVPITFPLPAHQRRKSDDQV